MKKFYMFLTKKRVLFILSVSIFVGFVLFARPALALSLGDFVTNLASQILFFPIWVIAKFMIWWTGITGDILNWVMGPNFTNLPYTRPGPVPPAGNPIIEVGLGITRGFVNIILVLILIFIGLSTILRLAGYETKKLLINFILVALLVNFSHVICGLVVDASNIVMNFFINNLSADAFSDNMSIHVQKISASFSWTSSWEKGISAIMQLIVLIGLLCFLSFVLLAFALLFIFRYIVIWLLVILSPLAFACYILPSTKKYWTMWWNQFIQWSIVGISCGFFLYLALLLVVYTPTSISAPSTGENPLFNQILPFVVPIIFLGIGLVFGLQTSAMGAGAIMNFVDRKRTSAGRAITGSSKWIGGKVWENSLRPRVEPKVRGWMASGIKGAEKVPVARWFIPEGAKKFAEMRPALEREQSNVKTFSSVALGKRVTGGMYAGTKGVGALLEMASRGDMQDLFKAGMIEFGAKSEGELLANKTFQDRIGKLLLIARDGGFHNNILRRDPRLGGIAAAIGMYKKTETDKETGEEKAVGPMSIEEGINKAVNESRDQHIGDWEQEVLKNPTVIKSMLANFDRDRWLAVGRKVKNGQETALRTIDGIFKDFIEKDAKKEGLAGMPEEKAWEKFEESIKADYGGLSKYFTALSDEDRFGKAGWRRGMATPVTLGDLGKIKGNAEQNKTIITDTSQTAFKEAKKTSEPQGRTSSGVTPKGRDINTKPPQGRKL
jgi:hypothetical protein